MNAAECGLQPALVRRLCLTAVIAALLGALPWCVQAQEPPPFVHVWVETDHLDLGSVPQPGIFDSPATLIVRVTGNVRNGGVVVSMDAPLDGPGGAEIPRDRIWVKLEEAADFDDEDNLTHPVMVTEPMKPGEYYVPIKFRLVTELADPAGEYTGTVVVTVGLLP